MLPTDDERAKLEELQHASDDIALGSAEQFLSMLCSIPDLTARLKLWAFRLDYDTIESVSITHGHSTARAGTLTWSFDPLPPPTTNVVWHSQSDCPTGCGRSDYYDTIVSVSMMEYSYTNRGPAF